MYFVNHLMILMYYLTETCSLNYLRTLILLSDADNDPLVLIESLTISEVLIESDVLVETLCDAAMLSDPETEPLVLVESLNDSDVLIDFESLVLNDIDVLCESDLLVDAL